MNGKWVAGLVGAGLWSLFSAPACLVRITDSGTGGSGSTTAGNTTSGMGTTSSTTSGMGTTSTSTASTSATTGSSMGCTTGYTCSGFLKVYKDGCTTNCPGTDKLCAGKSKDAYTSLANCACAKCASVCGNDCKAQTAQCDQCFFDTVQGVGAAGNNCVNERNTCKNDI